MAIFTPILSRIYRLFLPHKGDMFQDIRIPSLKEDGKFDSIILDIETWFQMVCERNKSEEDIKTFTVQQLDWYKNEAGFEHEYLVATITGPELGEKVAFLRFERRLTSEQLKKADVGDLLNDEALRAALEDERKRINAPKGPYVSSGSSTIRSSGNSTPDSRYMTADQVVRVRDPSMLNGNASDKAYLMITYSDFRTPFSLRDLAFIAYEVNQGSPRYNAITEQCYWLVRTIIGVAVNLYQPAVVVKTSKADRAGTFLRTPVNSDNAGEILKYANKVHGSIKADNQRMIALWKDGRGGRLEAEERARAEALARAEAEARARAEAAARVKAEAARLDAEVCMRAMEEELNRYRQGA
ncbi:hypothetical protein CPC08DRAFT_708599 [Agrocybe pediades]|nr:hypothetical protein CPC08DRAFT_708599 [Agrocybe pediades]